MYIAIQTPSGLTCTPVWLQPCVLSHGTSWEIPRLFFMGCFWQKQYTQELKKDPLKTAGPFISSLYVCSDFQHINYALLTVICFFSLGMARLLRKELILSILTKNGIVLYMFSVFETLPIWNKNGIIAALVLHVAISEPLFYTIHKCFHGDYCFTCYHSIHHSSPIPQRFTAGHASFLQHLFLVLVVLIQQFESKEFAAGYYKW